MKTFLALLLLLSGLNASAQSYQTMTIATNKVLIASTNSTAGTAVEILKQTSLTVFASGRALTNGGTGTITLNFQGSRNDSTYFANSYALTLAVNGTNTVSNFATLNTTPFVWLKLTSIENPSTNVFTNIVVTYLLK